MSAKRKLEDEYANESSSNVFTTSLDDSLSLGVDETLQLSPENELF